MSASVLSACVVDLLVMSDWFLHSIGRLYYIVSVMLLGPLWRIRSHGLVAVLAISTRICIWYLGWIYCIVSILLSV